MEDLELIVDFELFQDPENALRTRLFKPARIYMSIVTQWVFEKIVTSRESLWAASQWWRLLMPLRIARYIQSRLISVYIQEI